MSGIIFERARRYAVRRLERDLSPALIYHGPGHTRDEVVPAAVALAGMEGVQGASLDLLLTAAWFHDIGFLEQTIGHEAVSSRIASEVLPALGYAAAEVEIVQGIVLATRLPQAPATLLEAILADADLEILGCRNFMQRNDDLRRELALLGTEFTDRQWYAGQLHFVEQHRYFTASARSLLDDQKGRNLAMLRNALEQCAAGDESHGGGRTD